MHATWARWWIYLWAAVAIGLIVLIFLVPFKWWTLAAALGFGAMEAVGLLRRMDPYPPLTHVIRNYVPRWIAFPAIYGFTGAAGAVWFGFSRPERLGALFALLGWFTTHFDVAFDRDREGHERAMNQRLVTAVMRRKRAWGNENDRARFPRTLDAGAAGDPGEVPGLPQVVLQRRLLI